jgi:uncharacterized protein YndB with AHSA1/START domain
MAEGGDPNKVVIERILDAPADLIWRMWTEPEHFAAWYGPGGATIPDARMDVRVGGSRVVCLQMETVSGTMQMWFIGQYSEVVVNKRLVYTESMSDEDGNALSPLDMGLPPGHPTTTEVLVELDDLGPRTRMVMTHVGVPENSAGARGWNMAFDKLVAYVAVQSRPGAG